MARETTEMIFPGEESYPAEEAKPEQPYLFVCCGHTITEYRLEGKQTVGRPSEGNMPDIPISDQHVSKLHGTFHTFVGTTTYVAEETTNGVLLNGKEMLPGEKLYLLDGDELTIPAADSAGGADIMLIYAFSNARIHIWQELMQASKDQLTALPERDRFLSWWNRSRSSIVLSDAVVFIFDVDNFKQINDKYGHPVGDDVLRYISQQLLSVIEHEEQICRWGGDEFVGCILASPAEAEASLRTLSGLVASANVGEVSISISIGYVSVQDITGIADIEKLVGLADLALYDVKKHGKNGIRRYSAELSKEVPPEDKI